MKVALVSTGVAAALALTAFAVKRSRDQVTQRLTGARAAQPARTAPSRKTRSRKPTSSVPAARKAASRKPSAARG